MNDLITTLRTLLAQTVYAYYKAHQSHWNVTGADFPQYHEFLEDVYEALFEAIDGIGEIIRSLGFKAPATLATLATMQPVDPATEDDALPAMITQLKATNDLIITTLRQGISQATVEPAVQNFLQDRLMYHQKLGWMLTAILS
jgi:starvation-inducible DNA-binding protein